MKIQTMFNDFKDFKKFGSALLFVLVSGLAYLPTSAMADDALFDFKYSSKIVVGQGKPEITVIAAEFIQGATLTLEQEGGKTIRKKVKKMEPTDHITIPLKQPKGTYHYRLSVTGKSEYDQVIDSTFEFDISYVDPLTVHADPKDLNLEQRQIQIRANRPLSYVQLELFDKDAQLIKTLKKNVADQGTEIVLRWPPQSRQVTGLRFQAYDHDDFWTEAIVQPFWIEIPHDEIEFDTGLDTWKPDQTKKLVDTLKMLKQALASHKHDGFNPQLYIAGYTDTVGSAESNQTLSTRRARAIAQWFRKNKVGIDIFYQGFGEDVLMKVTPDETDEAVNRRATYILGNATPPTSQNLPRSNWNRL